MSGLALDEILSCPTLPSAPGIAVRILELTASEECTFEDMAHLITYDQGLVTRILRTVNSSFYGLSQKCASIERAVALLGMGPVKSLVLCFTLVDTLNEHNQSGFGFERYWRRALHSAIASKHFAEIAKLADPSEAFLAALLQDIGMIAMHRALGSRYAELVDKAGEDHRALGRYELQEFETQHADVGGMLASRWKLPDELVLSIKYHQRPTAGPESHAKIIRVVGLGVMAHDVLASPDPAAALKVLIESAHEWIGMEADDVREVLAGLSEQVAEAANMFALRIGEPMDCDALVGRAWDMMKAEPGEMSSTLGLGEYAGLEIRIDERTGVMNRDCFDESLVAMSEAATETSEPVGIVAVALEQLDHTNKNPQHTGRDSLMRGAATILRKHFEPAGGVVGRVSGSLLGVAVRGMSESDLQTAAEGFRAEYELAEAQWLGTNASHGMRGASVGVSWALASQFGEKSAPARLLGSAVQSLQAAHELGGNRVVLGSAKLAA